VTQLKGEAQAFAVEARGKAEAEQMRKKAEAWLEFREAAMVDMIVQVLPKVRRWKQVPRIESDGRVRVCRWPPRWRCR